MAKLMVFRFDGSEEAKECIEIINSIGHNMDYDGFDNVYYNIHNPFQCYDDSLNKSKFIIVSTKEALVRLRSQKAQKLYDYVFPCKKDYDFINPNHYKKGDKEVYEMMIDIWGKDAFIKHCEMCAFKYRMRLGEKPDQPIERDLEKAKWYENKAKELYGKG